MIEHYHGSPRLARRLAAIAILLASTAIAAPALACQNPSFAPRPTASLGDAEARPAIPDGAAAGFMADFMPATGLPSSIVGMWHTTFRLDSGNVYDETLEQFHDDGTELLISNGLPPALGNVCIGIWKRVGPRAYKLRHMTWNWSPDKGGFGVRGTFAGHFELQVSFSLDPSGRTFQGRWSAQNFDTTGKHLPDLDAEGVVRGVRLTID